jgi:hypothetical protein
LRQTRHRSRGRPLHRWHRTRRCTNLATGPVLGGWSGCYSTWCMVGQRQRRVMQLRAGGCLEAPSPGRRLRTPRYRPGKPFRAPSPMRASTFACTSIRWRRGGSRAPIGVGGRVRGVPGKDFPGDPQADPRDKPYQSAMRRAVDPWRATQAPHREVHGQPRAAAAAEPERTPSLPASP